MSANAHDVKTGWNVIRMFIKCKEKALERQTENNLFGNEIWEKKAQGSFTFYYTHSDLF